MQYQNRFLALCLTVLFAPHSVLSQDADLPDPAKPVIEKPESEIRGNCLRKIASGSYEIDLDISIDDERIGADIEAAVDNAIRSTELVLEGLQPIDMDFSDLNIDFDPGIIDLHGLDIDIEPVGFDMDAWDININEDQFRFDDDVDVKITGDDGKDEPIDRHSDDADEKNILPNDPKSKGLKKIE